MAEADLINSPTTSNLPAPLPLSARTIPAYLAPIPTSHFLRAWERRPRPALSRSSRTRTIWKKRWDLDRSALATSSFTTKLAKPSVSSPPIPLSITEADLASPVALRRVIKRRCVVLEDAFNKEKTGNSWLSDDDGTAPYVKRAGRGTSWERRESGRFRKRRIMGEKELFRLQEIEFQTPSPPRSPLKVANSLAHQGLSFSSPARQSPKEQFIPVERRRSSSADVLLDDSREIAPAVFMSMSEGEDMYLSDTIPDKVNFSEGKKFSIASGDQAEKFDYELCRAQKTMSGFEDMPLATHQLINDTMPLKSENGGECQTLQLEEVDHGTVTYTEDNVLDAATNEPDKDKPSDEVTVADSESKPKLDMHLVLDTALLRDFLDRAAASKERKRDDIAKQSSILHRRDSDAVRNALGSGSPTKALGERDPISPPQPIKSRSRSPDKKNSPLVKLQDRSGDVCNPESLLSEVNVAIKMGTSSSPNRVSRRSSRVRNNRVSQQNSEAPVNADDDHSKNQTPARSTKSKDKTPAKKTEAQELAQLTRKNSNKNKRGALPVPLRLADLAKGQEHASEQVKSESQADAHKETHTKTVTWAENLVQYSTSNEQVCIVLKKVSYSTPKKPHNRAPLDSIASSLLSDTSKLRSTKSESIQSSVIADEENTQTPNRGALPLRKSGAGTPRARRARGLGTSNGTPAKGLLASPFSSSEARESKESTTNMMEKDKAIEKRKFATTKREKQKNLKATAAIAVGPENRHVSKLVPPKVTGLAGLGIGKVNVPAPKSSSRR